MTPDWHELIALPRVALALVGGVVAAAWGLHIRCLRRRERHLGLLVDERTRLWQDEVSAHAALRAQVDAGPPASDEAGGGPACVTRVLVVGDRRDRRDAMTAVFDELGIAPVFADSPWAASVATHQADADGAPYDLILIDAAMEGIEAGDRALEAEALHP